MPIELYVILMICSKAEVYKFPNISYNISLPKKTGYAAEYIIG